MQMLRFAQHGSAIFFAPSHAVDRILAPFRDSLSKRYR